MNKRLTPIQDDDASYDIAKSLTPLRQISVETFSPLTDISSDHLKTHNEPIRASPVYRMTGYSVMKRQTSEHFFAKSQTKGFAPPSSIYRVCYGENIIPSAAEVGPKSTHTTIKPYIPPEYSKYEYKPHHLPTFLKERLYKTITTKRPVFNTIEDPAPNSGLVDQAGERSILQQLPAEPLPSIPRKSRLSKQHSVSVKEFGRISQASIDAGTSKLTDLPDFPYLSPKARQQMNGDSVPLLLTNVLLSGGINPQGLAPNDEAAVEHIINEYHIKSRRQGSVTPIRSKSQPRQKKLSLDKMHNIAVSVSLIQQNKKKKEGIMALQKMNPKYTMDKVGIRLKATVGYMHMEKEETKKRVLDLLKTKNFNLFRPGTINNMHLLKDALSNNEE